MQKPSVKIENPIRGSISLTAVRGGSTPVGMIRLCVVFWQRKQIVRNSVFFVALELIFPPHSISSKVQWTHIPHSTRRRSPKQSQTQHSTHQHQRSSSNHSFAMSRSSKSMFHTPICLYLKVNGVFWGMLSPPCVFCGGGGWVGSVFHEREIRFF